MRNGILLLVVMSVVVAACTTSGETIESTTTTSGEARPGPVAEPPSPPQIIPLLRSSGDAEVVYGAELLLTSQVISAEPVSRIELWADGAMVETVDFDDPVVDPPFAWEWTPESVGLHAIVLRAFNESGASADSFPSWIRVHPGADVITGEVRTGLPELDPPVGTELDVAACVTTLEVPAVADQLGQYVVGSTFGVAGSRAVDVLPASGGSVTIPITSSPVLVSVASYDSNIATPELQFVVPGAPECATGSWEGDVTFDGSLLSGGEGLDSAYAYVTDDDSNWRRIPETGFVAPGPGGFDFAGLLPSVGDSGHLEVEVWGRDNGQLVGLGRGRFTVQAEGPAQQLWGSAQPVTPFSDLKIVDEVLQGSSLTDYVEILLNEQVICEKTQTVSICANQPPHIVRWNAGLIGAEAGLIQISTAPPPKGVSLDYPGLLWTVEVAMDGDLQRDVELPLSEIRNGSWLSEEARKAGPVDLQTTKFDYADLLALEIDLGNFSEPAPSGGNPRLTEPIYGDWWSGVPHDRLWVRVVPFSDGKPIAGVSNPVVFRFEEAQQISVDTGPGRIEDYYDLVVTFTPPFHGSQDPFARCVRIVENPFGKENPVPNDPAFKVPSGSYWQSQFNEFRDNAGVWTAEGKQLTGLVPGATSCAHHKDPPDDDIFDFIEDAISFIGEVWDTFKSMIDMVKGGIIQGIVDITGCEPEATCKAALSALADAGLAAVGVPPTMPSFSELVEAAKGNIAEALAEQLVDQTCGDIPCADFAKTFVEDAIKDIEQHFAKMTVSHLNGNGGWYLYLNPEIVVVPEPAGQLFPGSVQVTFHPKPGLDDDPLRPTACVVSLVTDGIGPLSWTDKKGIHHEQESVQGEVFASESVTVNLSDLKTGDAMAVGVSGLDFNREQYLPGAHPQFGYSPDQDRLRSQALFSDPDTTFTMSANVCGTVYTKTTSQDLSGTTPADIPTK